MVQPDTTTTLAVDLGGAVIPTGVSVFLLVKYSIWWQAAVGVTVVALIVHLIAARRRCGHRGARIHPAAPGSGHFARRRAAHGSSRRLRVRHAGDPHWRRPDEYWAAARAPWGMASIGGAGTFDGVFLSGIVAVLLVSVR